MRGYRKEKEHARQPGGDYESDQVVETDLHLMAGRRNADHIRRIKKVGGERSIRMNAENIRLLENRKKQFLERISNRKNEEEWKQAQERLEMQKQSQTGMAKEELQQMVASEIAEEKAEEISDIQALTEYQEGCLDDLCEENWFGHIKLC